MSAPLSRRPPPEVEEKLKEYKAVEAEIQSLFSKKQLILSQLNENTLVQGEFGMIHSEDAKIFKLVGPVLIPVDFDEAKENVKKRLEFIEAEIKKVEGQIEAKQEELNQRGGQIQELQQKMQAEAASAARAVIADGLA